MPKTTKRDLATFAASKAIKPCWIEGITEFKEVLQGFVAGIPVSSIRRWLVDELGYSDVPPTETLRGQLRKLREALKP